MTYVFLIAGGVTVAQFVTASEAGMDMAHKNPNILTTRHLDQLCKNIKSNFVLTPLMEIVLNYWKNSELPTQNTYYDVMRRNKKQ